MDTMDFVTCRQCGGESPHDARFCIECGETLASATGPTTKLATPTCQSCGSENLPDARFCGICGRSMPQPADALQPWPMLAGNPTARRTHAPRPAPVAVAPPAAPRPVAPAPPLIVPNDPPPIHQPGNPSARPWRQSGPPAAAIVAMLGFGALAIMHALTMPAILLVVAATFLVHQAEHRRIQPAIRTILTVGMAVLVMSNPRFWPVLLIGFGIMKILGGRRVF